MNMSRDKEKTYAKEHIIVSISIFSKKALTLHVEFFLI